MNKKHGMSNSPEHRAWVNMRRRCNNPDNELYPNYGGRGIKVCERWNKSFEAFLQDMGERPQGTSIDRRNNDGDYEPENCYWATITEQNNNRRNVALISHDGKSLSLKQWSREIGVKYQTLVSRQRKGLSIEKILSPIVRTENSRS